jgi:hypothetical protein
VDGLPALAAALTGELELRAGRLDAAGERFEHAYALACQLGDPCWDGMTARGLGLLRASVGDHAKATAWLEEAHVRCSRVSDRYQWVRAYVLDAMVATALDQHDHLQAGRLAGTSRLGDPTALASARLLGASIDNPALARLLDGGPGGP